MTLFKTTVSRTVIFIAFVLMSAAFGLNVTAQTDTDKPMEAKSLAALVAELKGIVERSGADEKESALVAGKWDKRTDLSGKTRKQVINLLYEDVKAVIEDPGVQYQISSVFSMYKQIPDESPPIDTPKNNTAPAKAELVKTLIDLTLTSHPSLNVSEQIAELPKIQGQEEQILQSLRPVFDNALKQNKTLTAAKKSFVRANYDKVKAILDQEIIDQVMADFPFEQWIGESLQKSYSTEFTDGELSELITFFQSPSGQRNLKMIKDAGLADTSEKSDDKPIISETDEAELKKFAATPLGKKFVIAFLGDSDRYMSAKIEENSMDNDKKANDRLSLMEPAHLNKIFNQFVKDNYKTK